MSVAIFVGWDDGLLSWARILEETIRIISKNKKKDLEGLLILIHLFERNLFGLYHYFNALFNEAQRRVINESTKPIMFPLIKYYNYN